MRLEASNLSAMLDFFIYLLYGGASLQSQPSLFSHSDLVNTELLLFLDSLAAMTNSSNFHDNIAALWLTGSWNAANKHKGKSIKLTVGGLFELGYSDGMHSPHGSV